MTTKHTPGPWATDCAEHDGPYQTIRIRGANNRTVCDIWQDDAPVPEYNTEQRANARLIAAAPALLTVAEQALAAFSFLAIRASTKEDRKEFKRRAQAAAAAIAAAKGDLAGMWDAIPEAERKDLTQAFAAGVNEQTK